MPRSEAQKRADDNYRKKHLDYLTVRTKKEDRIRELINYASRIKHMSSNVYIIKSIQSQLKSDGITIDILSEPIKQQEEPKQPKQYMIYLITSWTASPEEYKQKALGKLPSLEDYVTTMQTLANAKTYISKKYPKKAHPEDWYFTIYGRYFEASNKLEANEKHKQLIEAAMMEQDKSMKNDDPDEWGWVLWLDALNEMHKPDYVEVVKYEDMKKENADVK